VWVLPNADKRPPSLKYIRLAAYLAGQPADLERLEMSVREIEDLVGGSLPASARFPSWWRNDRRRPHSRAWLLAGWRVESVGEGSSITFCRDLVEGAL
jgi:hypothetical protein